MTELTWVVIIVSVVLLALYAGYRLSERESRRLAERIRRDRCVMLALMSDQNYTSLREAHVDDQKVALDVDRRYGQRLLKDESS